jgi:hypothetical protein
MECQDIRKMSVEAIEGGDRDGDGATSDGHKAGLL